MPFLKRDARSASEIQFVSMASGLCICEASRHMNMITQIQLLGIGGASVPAVGDTTLSLEGESTYSIIGAKDFERRMVYR
jgi:hypothetical protein